MSLNDLTTVANILPRLDVSELMKVKEKTSALLSLSASSGVVSQSGGPVADYLLEGIMVELRRRGLLGSNARLGPKVVPTAYAVSARDMRNFLEEHVGKLNAAEYALLGQLVAKCLAIYLEKRDVPISPKSLCQAIRKVPQALDDSYPGYLEAGLLSFAWRK